MKKLILFFAAILVTGIGFAQNTVTGTVVDSEVGTGLPGASVVVKGSSEGVSTDFDGVFSINADSGSTLVISYIGYESVEVSVDGASLGEISLSPEENILSGVTVFGTVNLAKDRETPVAQSTLNASEIVERVGNLELPQLLNSTPGIYSTMQGGFGDARVRLRGFQQENIAVLINGMPVNDMENGAVYWSNWAGLSDVTSAMQVQRGLGSAKLPIPSVGGTINIVTKSTELSEGGKISATVGNDGYLKTVMTYNTGVSDSGHAFSASFGRTAGDGYVDGTPFEGYSYFLGYGYKSDDGKNNLQFIVTGAPQVHGQRTTSYYNMATLEDYRDYGIKYNYNYGLRNGEGFNMRNNYYHKPIASLNWELKLNNKTSLSATAYASLGRGGGSGDLGRNGSYGFFSSSRWRNPDNGYVLWDEVVKHNSGQSANWRYGSTSMGVDASTGQYIVNDESFSSSSQYPRRNGWIQRNSVNSHNWFGAIANLKTELAENLTLDVGFDSRFYKGLHYRNVRDLLGSDGYRDSRYNGAPNTSGVVAATKEYQWPIGDVWNVFGDTDAEEKIDRNNNGVIDYFGLYFQLEYLMDDISIFVQGSGSNKGFQREEFYLYANGDPLQYSDKVNIAGGTIKAGANWNIDAQNNLFANAGYFSKQPNLYAVFQNYDQIATPDDELFNEKIVGLELGYGFRSRTFDFNVNLYSTTWTDRFLFENVTINGERGEANFSGVKQVHTGVEFDGVWQLSPFVELSGMFTIGDYAYAGDVTDNAVTTNESNVVIGSATLYLDDAKVGDTAHSTAYLDLTVSPSDRFKFNLDLFHADKLYGSVNAEDFDEPGVTNMRMPSYEIFGAGASYRFPMGKDYVYLRLNVNNLFDEEYYQESGNNYLPTDRDGITYKGINVDNRVVPGWGRTWNLGLTYRF
jgi:hypothetical protein